MLNPRETQRYLPWWTLFIPVLASLSMIFGFIVGKKNLYGSRELALFNEVNSLVINNYVQPKSRKELLYSALQGMMNSLDRHSCFYPPKEAKIVEEESLGRYEGIGVALAPKTPPIMILYPFSPSPAETAGLLPGDIILKAGDIDLAAMKGNSYIEHIKGPIGTSVDLLIQRGKKRFRVNVERGPVKTSSIQKSAIFGKNNDIGYIFLREFQAHTVEDLDKTWDELERDGAKSLILDLRYNGGGSLSQASLLINRFIAEDGLPLVRVVGRVRRTTHTYTSSKKEGRLKEIPIVVLVNGKSASAAEVFAAAIQDSHRGPIVGRRTFGKGTVQTLSDLSDNTLKVKYTIARYSTTSNLFVEPTKSETKKGAGRGVVPDVEIPISKLQSRALINWLFEVNPPKKYYGQVKKIRERLGYPLFEVISNPQIEAAIDLLGGNKPAQGNGK